MTPFTLLIERARAIRIEDEVARRNIKLCGRGADRCGPCPVCGGDDRFSVHSGKQVFNCRGCNVGGDIIALVQHLDGVDVKTAVYTLTGGPKPNGGGNGLARAIAKARDKDAPKDAADKPEDIKDALKETAAKKVTSTTFQYTDEAGVVAYAVDRLEYQNADGSFVLKDGKRKKTFRQRRPDPERPGEWLWNLDGVIRVPYRLPELIEAVAAGRLVYIVEGEACVEALREIGSPATTNSEGAGKWKPDDLNKYLRGADVVLLPDANEIGWRHITEIAASLAGIATRTRVLLLPDLPEKGDVVDWLAAGGTRDQLDALAETASDWEQPTADKPTDEAGSDDGKDTDPDLAEMNGKYAVVKLGGKTRVVEFEESAIYPGCRVPVYSTIADFCAFHAKRKKWKGETSQGGLGRWWINHTERQQYDGVVYAPNKDVAEKLNLWTGFSCEPMVGDCGLYLTHLRDNVCGGDETAYEYLLSWMAHGVQKPGEASGVAVVLRGKEGVGKGTMAQYYGGLFGSHFRQVVHAKHLTGHFNAHLQHCSCLFADEAFFAGDRAHESILKALITEETFLIEPKGVDPFPVRNCVHLIMSSNSDWVVPAGADARRYFVLNVGDDKKQDEDYFFAITEEMNGGGRAALLDILLERDLSGFNIRKVPQTEALAEQKQQSRRGIDQLVELVCHEGTLPGAQIYPDIAITALLSRRPNR